MTETTTAEHRFFEFEASVDRAVVRELGVQLANYYLKRDLSRTGWKNQPRTKCAWEAPVKRASGIVEFERRESVPINLGEVEGQLCSGTFEPEALGLPPPSCFWLDSSIEMSSHSHLAFGDQSLTQTFSLEPNFGARFPLLPALDREGAIFTSFQTVLLRRIFSLRNKLTEYSAKPGSETWFQDFRTVISECVSLIDNTLHQLYLKAEFDPEPGWTFAREVLGERHRRRMSDKLRWVRQITRKDLCEQDGVRGFHRIRELRNHLQHFDPPSFAFTFEEAGEWLNDVLQVARLAWRIRRHAGALPSIPLVDLLLQRRVRFQPIYPSHRRIKPPHWSGYASTRWSPSSRPPSALRRVTVTALPPVRIV